MTPRFQAKSDATVESFDLMEFGTGKAIARRVAQELKQGWAVNLGLWRVSQCAPHLH